MAVGLDKGGPVGAAVGLLSGMAMGLPLGAAVGLLLHRGVRLDEDLEAAVEQEAAHLVRLHATPHAVRCLQHQHLLPAAASSLAHTSPATPAPITTTSCVSVTFFFFSAAPEEEEEPPNRSPNGHHRAMRRVVVALVAEAAVGPLSANGAGEASGPVRRRAC